MLQPRPSWLLESVDTVQWVLSHFYFDLAWVRGARGLLEGDISCLSFAEPVSVQLRWCLSFIACNGIAVALWCDCTSVWAVLEALV